jgi:hypothetical protein
MVGLKTNQQLDPRCTSEMSKFQEAGYHDRCGERGIMGEMENRKERKGPIMLSREGRKVGWMVRLNWVRVKSGKGY